MHTYIRTYLHMYPIACMYGIYVCIVCLYISRYVSKYDVCTYIRTCIYVYHCMHIMQTKSPARSLTQCIYTCVRTQVRTYAHDFMWVGGFVCGSLNGVV